MSWLSGEGLVTIGCARERASEMKLGNAVEEQERKESKSTTGKKWILIITQTDWELRICIQNEVLVSKWDAWTTQFSDAGLAFGAGKLFIIQS